MNISASGILFTVRDKLPLEIPVEVVVDWPVKGKEDRPVKLYLHGRVVRQQDGMVAARVYRSEFIVGDDRIKL